MKFTLSSNIIFLALIFCPLATVGFDNGITISMKLTPEAFVGKVSQRTTLAENSTTTVVVDRADINPDGFLIFQVHSHIYPIELSRDAAFHIGNFIDGTNVGLHSELNATHSTFFIRNLNCAPAVVMLVPVVYPNGKPIPGGCNLSFATKIAPYMSISFNESSEIIQVDAQPAVVGGKDDLCRPSHLEYEFYELNIEDTTVDAIFDGILSMVTPDSAIKNGLLTRIPNSQQPLRRRFAIYHGFAKIVVASVKDPVNGTMSAYVPVASYDLMHGSHPGIYNRRIVATEAAWFLMYLWVLLMWSLDIRCDEIIQLSMGIIATVQIAFLKISADFAYSYSLAIGLVIWMVVIWKVPKQISFATSKMLFPLSCAQLLFGAAIWCGLGRFQGFEGSMVIWTTFACFYLFALIVSFLPCVICDSVIAMYGLTVICTEYFCGAASYVLIDAQRILNSEASNAIFSNMDIKNAVHLAVWAVLTIVWALVGAKIRPPPQESEGYQSLHD